jgi:radical SAM protein with 4Fe4S-binding SPASM domain
MIVDLRDAFNLFGKLSLPRMLNILLVTGSYHYSRWVRRPVQRGLPIGFSIEPTTACNLGCPECPSGLKQFKRPTGNLKQEVFKNAIDQLSNKSLYLTFYFQGEPYINPGFLDMVHYASAKRMYTATSTNAHFLSDENARKTVESGLDRLIISIDGTTQETYASYRVNGQLNKVIAGTQNVIRWKKQLKSSTPKVVFQFLVVKPNEHQLKDVEVLAKELGVDELKFKTAQLYDYEKGNQLMPSVEKYSRYKKLKDGTYALKNKLLNQCWKMWHSCVITWDGKVVPCCFDKDADHQLGDLSKHAFRQIWFGKAYQDFRMQLLGSRKSIDICANCSEGTKVWQ